MKLVELLGALVVGLIAGWGSLLWLCRREQKMYVMELIAFSWLIGSAAVSFLLPVAGIVARGPSLIIGISVCCLAIGAAAIFRKNVRGPQIEMWPAGTASWEKWMCTLLAGPVIWLFVNSFREPMMWDGLLLWEFKARIGFNNGGQIPASYFSDKLVSWTHPSNPLYLPYLELWFYLWFRETHQLWLKFIFPLFPAAASLLLWSFAVRLSGRVWLGCITGLLLFAIPHIVAAPHGPIHGYADFPLGTFYMAAVTALVIGAKESSKGWFAIAALCAGVLPWIKQEGAFLWFSVVLQCVWVFRRQFWMICKMALPGGIVLAAWNIALVYLQPAEDKVFHPLTVETFVKNASRIPPLAQRFAGEFLHLAQWSVLWILAGGAIICLWWRNRAASVLFLIALAVPLALDFIPYIFTARPLAWHVESSISRLFLQVTAVAVAAIGMAFAGGNEAANKFQALANKDPENGSPRDGETKPLAER